MDEEICLLEKEVSDLKKTLADLTVLVRYILKEIENNKHTTEGFNEEVKTEPKITWETQTDFSDEKLGRIKEDFQSQFREQGFSDEQIKTALKSIENLATIYFDNLPNESEEDVKLKNVISQELGKNMEAKGADVGVVIASELILDKSYHAFFQVDTDKAFLTLDTHAAADFFGVFANEQRLNILRTLFEHEELTAQQLQEKTGIPAGGQFYHHLREIDSANLLAKTKRGCYALSTIGRSLVALIFTLARSVTYDGAKDVSLLANMLAGLSKFDIDSLSNQTE